MSLIYPYSPFKVKTTLNSFGLGTVAELSTPWFKTKSVAHKQGSELHRIAGPDRLGLLSISLSEYYINTYILL